MEIKTSSKTRDTAGARVVPPPDRARRSRKKAANKLGKSQIVGRRLLSVLKVLGRLGAFFMIAGFMLSVFLFAYRSETFNLRSIQFYGCKELDGNQLEEIVRREFPANVLRIDLQQLKERLENETWAKRVEIRRILPSNLIIYVQERTPAVIVQIHDEMMIVDENGILLGGYNADDGKLDIPVFKGVLGKDPDTYVMYQDENAARIRQGLAMLAEIKAQAPHAISFMSEVDVSDRKNMKALLVDDVAEVSLGDTDYGKRFVRLMDNMDKYRELKDQFGYIESIDLRFDDKIVWRPVRTNDTKFKGI